MQIILGNYIFGVVLILSGRERESRFCSESRVSACALSLASVTYLVSTSLFLSCVSTFGHVCVSIPYLLEFIQVLCSFPSKAQHDYKLINHV